MGAHDGITPPDCAHCDVLEPLPSSKHFTWEYSLADVSVMFVLYTGPFSGADLGAAAAGEFIMTSRCRN
jgi:hypothetical protein